MCKIRRGFVSNSSSSSFVCEVCGTTHEGWDSSYMDFEMFCCKNGHEIHESCSDLSFDNNREIIKEALEGDTDQMAKDFKIMEEDEFNDTYEDEIADIMSEARYSVDEKHCPICNLKNKPINEVIDFVNKRFKLDIKI